MPILALKNPRLITKFEAKSLSMEETLQDTPEIRRPVFLSILCVLTFIGSGFGLSSGISNYMNAEQAVSDKAMLQEAIDDAREQLEESGGDQALRWLDEFSESVNDSYTVENLKVNGLGNAASSLVTLLGALMMWRLRRIGFHLYVAGSILATFVPYYAYGGGMIGLMNTLFTGAVGLLFIVLYALHLKHLQK